ncbi:hypothetical protein [Streptomyces sp. NPDC002187]|uniref:hypothetical protein n=1 Tax=Streptomyces sp. NPDC002187 TaxID=3364637 RepID=UPI0036763536
MRLPIKTLTLATALLMGAVGCTTVEPAPRPASPAPAPAGAPSPAAAERPYPAQPSAREELVATGPENKSRRHTQPETTGDRPAAAPARAVPDPAVRRAGVPKRTVQRPRTHRPRPVVRMPRPRPKAYDMHGLCNASDGLTNPGITVMCRDAYGR